MDSSRDEELWEQLKSGNRQALEQIYNKQFSFLYNYGKKIFGDSQIVEDSIQELFLDIWNTKERLGHTDSIRRYLAISLKRKIIRQLKKRQKTQLKADFTESQFNAELSVESIIVNAEVSKERAERIKTEFEKLPDRQKEVIYLKFYGGMDNESIAENMNINNQSVRNLVYKAIKKLQQNFTLFLLSMMFL